MEENSFHMLVEIVKIISNADKSPVSVVVHELYSEFENFLTDIQKNELKQTYNV